MKKDYFHVNDVETQELIQVLLEHFSQSKGAYRFQRPNTQHFLDVACDDIGNIKSIEPSRGFPEDELEEIEKKIQDTLLAKPSTKVSQIICFCDTKITGYFRYKDLFQILPLPDDATKPNNIGLADYPFILEATYEPCPSPMIDNSRRKAKAVVYTRLLNLLSDQMISPGSRYTQFGWALKTEDPGTRVSEWSQLGYVYPGLKGAMDEFSSVEGLSPIERVPYQTYYTAPPARSLNPLTLPDSLEQSLDKAFSLSGATWRKFFMACSWYAQYRHTWEESHSSAFIALVTALECLAQEKEVCRTCSQPILENEEDICPSCGQPRYRVTKHFQDFLKKYFPFIDQFPKEKKILYQVRSQLAHGMDLLQADLEPWKFLFGAKEQEQNTLQRNLYYIVRIAVYNWLHSATSSSP